MPLGDISDLVARGLIVPSPDFAVERLPDGRSKIKLLRTLKPVNATVLCDTENCPPLSGNLPGSVTMNVDVDVSFDGCPGDDCPNITWDGTIDPENDLTWLRSDDPEFYNPDGATGLWCEANESIVSGSYFMTPPPCAGAASLGAYLGFGEINGNCGWHVLVALSACANTTTHSPVPPDPNCQSCAQDNWQRFFLGEHPSGPISFSVAGDSDPATFTVEATISYA